MTADPVPARDELAPRKNRVTGSYAIPILKDPGTGKFRTPPISTTQGAITMATNFDPTNKELIRDGWYQIVTAFPAGLTTVAYRYESGGWWIPDPDFNEASLVGAKITALYTDAELSSLLTTARADGARAGLLEAADEFALAAQSGIEPVLNALAAKLLRQRADRSTMISGAAIVARAAVSLTEREA